MKKFWLLLGFTLLLIGVLSARPFPLWLTDSTPTASTSQSSKSSLQNPLQKHQGMSWTAEPQPLSLKDFESLVATHVNWIAQTPFGWQMDYDSPDLHLKPNDGYWGETDEGLTVTTQRAHKLGIKTLLKPHIWLTRPRDGKWRTDIAMTSEADWQTWFQNYRTFILHYADLAEQLNIEAFCIGTELQATALQREQDWRQLIAEIRQRYSGQLTYAANWYQSYEKIRFWDDLDMIGIQAYFPLSDTQSPSVEQLKSGWKKHLKAIARVQAQYQKPVLFTEIGYRSSEDAAISPWEWPDTSEKNPAKPATPVGLITQANCYEAFFETAWNQDWLAGVYWWKWFPSIGLEQSIVGEGFTPQNKPAQNILKKWYGNQHR